MEKDKNLEQNLDKNNEKLHISDVMVSDVLEQIEGWKELKECYRQEIEMGNDIITNKFLYENCDKEIKNLELLINH